MFARQAGACPRVWHLKLPEDCNIFAIIDSLTLYQTSSETCQSQTLQLICLRGQRLRKTLLTLAPSEVITDRALLAETLAVSIGRFYILKTGINPIKLFTDIIYKFL
jgi:hypothetical protein